VTEQPDRIVRSVRVRVLPLDAEVEVPPGSSLMEAAQAMGLRWPTSCQGVAICTRCVVEIDPADAGAFSPMRPDEHQALDTVRWRGETRTDERLACQVRVRHDVTVRKRFVRWQEETGP
jgi:2Fe-2S ferredoxin